MTAAVLAILGALVPFVVWLARRHINKEDDPTNENLARKESADRALARSDTVAINRQLNDDLERLQDPAFGSTSRQGSDAPTGRPDAKGNQ